MSLWTDSERLYPKYPPNPNPPRKNTLKNLFFFFYKTRRIVPAVKSGLISDIFPGNCPFVILMSVISRLGECLAITFIFSGIPYFLVCVRYSGLRWVSLGMQLGYGKSERGHFSPLVFLISGIFFSHRAAVLLTVQTRIGSKSGVAYVVNLCL